MVPPTPVADTGALPIAGARTWAAGAETILDPGLRGVVRVLGGPGTGKTSLLVDTAAARIGAGADPESVLLLTGSGRLGARTRGLLTTALLSSRTDAPCRAAVREPLVRSVHAYAFAVLRLAAQRQGDPPPVREARRWLSPPRSSCSRTTGAGTRRARSTSCASCCRGGRSTG